MSLYIIGAGQRRVSASPWLSSTGVLSCSFSTSSATQTGGSRPPPVQEDGDDDDPAAAAAASGHDSDPLLVYESPLGNLVTRLRSVSLATGIIGSLGLPLAVLLKGGDLPSTGLLAVGLAFCGGTMGTTAVVHFCFRPYVYRIELIPVRKCHYPKKKTEPSSSSSDDNPSCTGQAGDLPKDNDSMPNKDMLYKAVSRSLFLREVETVFDAGRDVEPYSGLRPLCNFSAKGVPLYVHTEYLYGAELRRAMRLDEKAAGGGKRDLIKDNPDDFF